jgi:hypothetical protein
MLHKTKKFVYYNSEINVRTSQCFIMHKQGTALECIYTGVSHNSHRTRAPTVKTKQTETDLSLSSSVYFKHKEL